MRESVRNVAIRYLTHHNICAILYLTEIWSSTDGNPNT